MSHSINISGPGCDTLSQHLSCCVRFPNSLSNPHVIATITFTHGSKSYCEEMQVNQLVRLTSLAGNTFQKA
jgi:hypothetical protein